MGCTGLSVPGEVMHHVVRVESSFNPYAIGVVGGRLVRQPKSLPEALATVRMLEDKGYNFSLGLAQVNRYNLVKYGLYSYEKAFDICPNLQAGSQILAECYGRSGGDWGKSFSCYYSGNFTTGYRHGYVQKIYASINDSRRDDSRVAGVAPIEVQGNPSQREEGGSRRQERGPKRTALTATSPAPSRVISSAASPTHAAAIAPSVAQAIAPSPQASPVIVSATSSIQQQEPVNPGMPPAVPSPPPAPVDEAFVF